MPGKTSSPSKTGFVQDEILPKPLLTPGVSPTISMGPLII